MKLPPPLRTSSNPESNTTTTLDFGSPFPRKHLFPETRALGLWLRIAHPHRDRDNNHRGALTGRLCKARPRLTGQRRNKPALVSTTTQSLQAILPVPTCSGGCAGKLESSISPRLTCCARQDIALWRLPCDPRQFCVLSSACPYEKKPFVLTAPADTQKCICQGTRLP